MDVPMTGRTEGNGLPVHELAAVALALNILREDVVFFDHEGLGTVRLDAPAQPLLEGERLGHGYALLLCR